MSLTITNQEIYGDVLVVTLTTPPHTDIPVVVETQITSANRDQYAVLVKGSAEMFDPSNNLIMTCHAVHTDDTQPMTYERGIYTIKTGDEITEHLCFSKRNALVDREELRLVADQSANLEHKKCILVASGTATLNGVSIAAPRIVGVHSAVVEVKASTEAVVIGIK